MAADFDPAVDIVHLLPPSPSYAVTDGFRRLVAWWRGRSGGVCCLAGIGGGGKTAAVDEFLRRVGVLSGRPGDAGRTGLPAPSAAFVFTLAQGSVDGLLDALRLWVPGEPSDGAGPGHGILVRDLGRVARGRTDPVLVVVDGIEAVQSSGGSDGIGRIADARLRELMVRCAFGALPGVALLVTSRLAPTDIEIQRLPAYTRIDLDVMDAPAAVELLRAEGLRGSDRELGRVGESYGNHALTLALAARYAGKTGNLPAAAGTSTDDVVHSYVALARADGDTGLVELLSLFRRGTSTAFLRAAADRLGLGPLDDAEQRLQRLLDLRIATRSARAGADTVTMHEIVRSAVHDDVEPARRREWHAELARIRLEDLQARWTALDVSGRFDGLAECLTHLVQGDDPMAAFLLYWERIGNFMAIGHQASRFTWGEAACRTINEGRPPDDVAPYLLDDDRGPGSPLLGDWALYLTNLGELDSAAVAYRGSYEIARSRGHSAGLPVAAANVADLHLRRGALGPALDWAHTAERYAGAQAREQEGFPTAEVMDGIDESADWKARAILYSAGAGAAAALLDELAATHAAAAEAVRSFNSWSIIPIADAPIFDLERFHWGRPACELMLVRGDLDGAARVASLRLDEWTSSGRPEALTSAAQRLLLARALLGQGRGPAALSQIQVVENWARSADAIPAACEVHLLRAGLAVLDDDPVAATEAAERGLGIAREAGLGLLHIELLVALGQAALRRGRPDEAAHAAATALFGQELLTPGVALYRAPARDEQTVLAGDDEWYEHSGVFPPPETGRPALLAATHPDCRYRWGEAPARVVLAEALLNQLARYSGTTNWLAGDATAEAVGVIDRAAAQLRQAADLLDELSGSARTSRPIRSRIGELEAGVLTLYPLDGERATDPGAPVPMPSRRRLLISYSRHDSDFVDRLADELQASFGDVWLDRRRIAAGRSFVAGINNALTDVTDFVVVLSAAAIESLWVRNELEAAIALRNAPRPLTIYPVLLDGVQAPPLIANLNAVRPVNRDPVYAAARLAAASIG